MTTLYGAIDRIAKSLESQNKVLALHIRQERDEKLDMVNREYRLDRVAEEQEKIHRVYDPVIEALMGSSPVCASPSQPNERVYTVRVRESDGSRRIYCTLIRPEKMGTQDNGDFVEEISG
jgi:hypothetical protein